MFESLVANLLNRFLGSYIENFDQKQLNIGIWSGDVKLRNLRLKKESLDKFRLPIDVKFGHLGELTLQIPWSNLKSKPVKVIIENVYLLASPIIVDDLDPEEEHAREMQLKRQKLEDLEAVEKAITQNQTISNDMNANESFTESLITKIVDNVQVTIKNIHVRYEDEALLTENPYSIGFTLDELSAVSTDDSWLPSFISITQAFTHKLLTLKSLSCYMNTNSDTIYTNDTESLLENFKSSIYKSDLDLDSNPQCQFLLKPVTGKGRLTIHKAGATESHPHVKGEFFFEEFGLDLDSQQYRDMLWTASKFHWFMKTQKFRKLRPKISPSEDPKSWFRYAANCILDEIHERNYKWSWAHFAKRRDQRKAYVSLWKSKQLDGTLSKDQQQQFESLEEELPFEDIKFYRSLARGELRKDNLLQKTLEAKTEQQQQQQKKNTGWFSGWWGNSNSENAEKSSMDDEGNLMINEDQRKALYDAIDYDEMQELSDSVNVPRDRVTMELLATLKKGGVSIRNEKGSPNLGEVVFEGCTVQVYQRPDSILTNFQLQEFRVEDGTETTLYKHIVSVKETHSQLHENSKNEIDDPFFQISFENNPLDESADSILLGKLRSMTIFYNPIFIQEIARFFTPPKMHLDTVGAIMNAAEATMEGFTAQTRLGLQYALEEHKTIKIQLDMQAPLIFLPLRPDDWKSPVAILDAGHISVVSDLVDKKEIEEIKSKDNYTTEDWNQLNTLMYDQFNIHLQDAQFLVGPDIKTTTEQLHTNDQNRPALILDRFSIKLGMGVSILPEAYNLAKFKISADVPSIKLSLTDYQYKTIMSIIDVAIPNLDNIDTEAEDYFSTFESSGNADVESNYLEDEDTKELSAAALNQHQFEFEFNIDSVKLSLLRCIDPVTLETEPLVDLIGDSLHFFLWKTVKNMHIDLTLKDINVMDNIEKSGIPEFQKLLSSNSFIESDEHNDGKELFKVEIDRSQRLVNFNNKEIEIFDQDIKLHIATMKFVITRKSVLSILNFVLNTFTDPNTESPADELKHNDANNEYIAPQKINVAVYLDSIIIVLNEDGLKLATLQLSTADIECFVLPEALDVRGKLGALSLHDEVNHGSPRDSILRSLISIEGDALAEFNYKTFDKENNTKPYNSEFTLKSGAATINFVEDAFSKIIIYLSQFQKMKEIYDQAREAAIVQAQQYDDANNIKFDILIKAPTIVYPKLASTSTDQYDQITCYLGEFFASNNFKSGEVIENVINLGIRNIQVVSDFKFDDGNQVSEIVDNLDLNFSVTYLDQYIEDQPTMKIDGHVPELDIHLTELQLTYLRGFVDSIMRVADSSEDTSMRDIEIDAENANAVIASTVKASKSKNQVDETTTLPSEIQKIPSDHKKIDATLRAPRIALTIYNKTYNCLDIDTKKLSCFSLNGLFVKFDMNEDTHFKALVEVHSFLVDDVRVDSSNQFKNIIPSIEEDKNQFSLTASSDGPANNKNTTVILNVVKPKTILALDYIFELQSFVTTALAEDSADIFESKDVDSSFEETIDGKLSKSKEDTDDDLNSRFGFSINIYDPSVTLLADSSNKFSDAIVFKIGQVMISSQNVISLGANDIGMFLGNMENLESKNYRIIDDFSISFACDSRGSDDTSFLTQMQASIDPVLMRLSLRDIRLAMEIFNSATAYYLKANGKNESSSDNISMISNDFKRKLSQYAPSIQSTFSTKPKKMSNSPDQVIVKGEECNASIGGLRFVLIGDIHELPILDARISPFEVKAINWSTDLSAEVHIETLVNIYNYARSTWEPLIEPWPITVYASKNKEAIIVDVVSRTLAEISITSRSVALLSKVFSLITTDEKMKNRGEDSPYRILNETGHPIKVWINQEKDERANETIIQNQEIIPFAFEDWRKIRENLDTDNSQNSLNLEILDTPYNIITDLSVTGEGEDVYKLQPAVGEYHNRLAFNITLGEDNVKTIEIRSTILVQNDAENAIEFNIDDGKKIITIEPNSSRSIPIENVYSGLFKVRPHLKELSYNWSDISFSWKTLMREGCAVVCQSQTDKSSYYLQVDAVYNKQEPLAKLYPHMKIVISAPVEIENLLPYDLDYRLYDKSAKKDWNGTIPKGVNTFVHVSSLSSLLLLSVTPQCSGFGKSEFAIINSPKGIDFKRESWMNIINENGQKLTLKIHYAKSKSNGNSLKVVIFAPYIILNKTGQNIVISERGNITRVNGGDSKYIKDPVMFSFERDEENSNRALLKIGDSAWTSPVSFDAIGQSCAEKAQLNGRQSEINIGIHIEEGSGIYKLTKVVTISPRYVFRNTLEHDLQIVESGSTKTLVVKKGEMVPLYGLRKIEKKNFLLKFEPSSKPWSAPFSIDDVGQIFLKVYLDNVGQILLKINTVIENSTIYVQVENANDNWPFSIKNFSDSEFYIYQADPNINENGDKVRSDIYYKPIFYRIPPKSVMPYAYDYPNAMVKEIILRSHDRERNINLAEIGNLRPFRLPQTDTLEQAVVDLNVVADGPTQSLVISEYDPSVSLYKLKDGSGSSSTANLSVSKFEADDKDDNYHTKIVTKFEGFGISLINVRGQELCYITLRGIEVRYNESDLLQNLSVKLKWIQIDNQLYGGIFPIVLYPSVLPKSSKEMNNHPTFSASVSKLKDNSHGVLFVKFATILLQEMTIEIDEDFLFALLDFAKFPGSIWDVQPPNILYDENSPMLVEPKSLEGSSDVYFEGLHLQPALLNLSFVRTERVNAEDNTTSSQNTLMFFFNILTMAIGNITDAPIKLNALFIENVRVPIPVLMESVQTHYGQAFFYQLHKILGSADFLGNPVGLFNNISSGVLDIFYEPYQGFVINDRPQEIGIGLAKGGLSFLKKSIFGFSDSFAKMTGSIAKGLSVVTMDRRFQERRRRNQRRNVPKHALYGFKNGANSFFESFGSGVTGIATAPMEGATKEGAAGFFKGLGKGFVGLPTKTAIGFFDLASNVGEGIRNTTTVFDTEGLDKVRLPRFISFDRIVRPYVNREAQGQYWLKSINGGTYINESYLAHLVLAGEEKALIVTFNKLIMFEINSLKSDWSIPFESIKKVTIESTGIIIGLKNKRNEFFIPIADRASRSFIYGKIGVAVQAFNKQCQVDL